MAFAARRPAQPDRRGLTVAGVEIVFGWSATITAFLVGTTVAEGVLPQSAPGGSMLSYWVAGAVAAAVFLLSLLAHELSHALAARRFGVRVDRITLWMFGGVARMTSAPKSPGAEFTIAVAGPLASFVAAGVLFLAALLASGASLALPAAALAWLAYANVMLGGFNLVPAFPLDGGRVARAIAWKVTGSMHRATRGAAILGRVFGLGLVLLGLYWLWQGLFVDGVWSMLLGWFLRQAASAEEMGEEVSEALAGLRVSDVMEAEPPRVPDWVTVQQVLAAPIPGRGSALLLHGLDGTVTGLVLMRQAAAVPAEAAAGMRVSALAAPLDSLPRVEATDAATEALQRLSAIPERVVLVYSEGELAGLLTPEGVGAALRARGRPGALRPGPGPAPPAGLGSSSPR